jgi:hypothetical protein
MKLFISMTVAAFALLSSASCCHAQTQTYECEDNNPSREIALIKESGNTVKRKGKHEISITTSTKTLSIKDKPPYDVDYGGVFYTYCGHENGYYMLFKRDQGEGNFSGILVNDKTGAILPGGKSILFSPDMNSYLTSEQPDGLDGEVLKVYTIDGHLTWNGYSFIERESHEYMYATLSLLDWNDKNVLTAWATCAGQVDGGWKVKLLNTDGHWDWSPKRHPSCPINPK